MSALAITASCVLVLCSIGAGATPAQAATPSASVVGKFAANGQAISGAQVGLWAWPNGATLAGLADGATVPLLLVASATTSSTGAYTLQPDLTKLGSSYFEPSGAVALTLQVARTSSAQITSLSAALPGSAAATESPVAVPGTPATVNFDSGTGKVQSSLVDSVSTEDGATDVETAPAHTYQARSSNGARASGASAASVVDGTPVADPYVGRDPVSCSGFIAGAKSTGKPEHFVNVHAWSGASASLNETSNDSHTLGVGLRYDGGAWGANGTSENSTSIGNGATRVFATPTSVSNQVNYRQFKQTCVYQGGTTSTETTKATGFYALEVPALDKPISMPGWTSCVIYGADVHLVKTKGKNDTYAAGVNLGFVSLLARDTFTKNMSLNWHTTAKSFYCGSDGQGPAAAPRALVKKWVSGGGGCGVIKGKAAEMSARC
jgi:hypothetical protein